MPSPPFAASELARLAAELAQLGGQLAGPLDDGAVARLLDREELLTRSVALAAPRSVGEVMLKLDLLCARLRQTMDTAQPYLVLTYLLAESAREDLRRLSPAPAHPGAG